MTETTLDLRGMPKPDAYAMLKTQIDTVLDDVDDDVTAMATVSALVHHAFGNLWTGFYRVVEPGRLLRVGPYQGTLGCMEIAFGRGVCGTVAASGVPALVRDVRRFAGHIACDPRARSEVVVPVADRHGNLTAVLDVDADRVDGFDEDDVAGLTLIASWFSTPRPERRPPLG